MLTPGAQRDRFTAGTYIPKDPNEALGRYENAMLLVTHAEAIYTKVQRAVRKGEIPKQKDLGLLFKSAQEKGIITAAEFDTIQNAEKAATDAIQVDDFSLEEFRMGPNDFAGSAGTLGGTSQSGGTGSNRQMHGQDR
jgi:acyl-CoA dehydrogenase